MEEGNQFIRIPVAAGGRPLLRHGVLQSDLIGQTTIPVLAAEIRFRRNRATSGSHGTWENVLDKNGAQVYFKVIEYILESTKKLPAGRRVGCVKVARDVWVPWVSQCPEDV